MATLIRNLEEKTGKSIDAWVVIGRGSGKTKHKDLVAWLKSDHGLSHGYANQVAIRTLAAADSPAAGSEDLVIAQYSGTKAGMRPVYDALVKHISKFGPDVEFSPKKAYVSLRRSKQFGLIQPTAARVDVGIVLKDVAPGERLEASGSFNAMVTHRVRISNVREVDSALIGWLRQAYDKA
jgi:predicted transport protein